MNTDVRVRDDDTDDRRAIDFLVVLGARRIPHSGRTLDVHLTGTHRILRDWRCPRHVRMAGLYHSVYGTPSFEHRLGSDRDAVRRRIGVAAEALVDDYSRLCHGEFIESLARGGADRSNAASDMAGLPVPDFSALAHVVVANELELAVDSSLDLATRRRIATRISRKRGLLAPFLSAPAMEALARLRRSPLVTAGRPLFAYPRTPSLAARRDPRPTRGSPSDDGIERTASSMARRTT